MATLSINNPTLLDVAKRTDPNGQIAAVAEILTLRNEILDDMTWTEGNLPTGNRSTVRTGIPMPTWRRLYGGVQPNKSKTAQVTDNCGMLEAYAEVDKALADLNGNTNAFRLSENIPHIEGFNQTVATALFYGDENVTPEAFTGLGARFNSLEASNGENIINAGGTGSTMQQSIWLVVWSPETVHGIVPKGSKAGLQVNDKGLVTIENIDGNNGRAEAYRTHYRWDVGLTVKDWRYVVRIANIDTTALKPNPTPADAEPGANGPDLADLMFQAIEQIPVIGMGRPVFYMTRLMRGFLRRQVANATKQSTLTIENVGGKSVANFQGVPVRRVDALQVNETTIA